MVKLEHLCHRHTRKTPLFFWRFKVFEELSGRLSFLGNAPILASSLILILILGLRPSFSSVSYFIARSI